MKTITIWEVELPERNDDPDVTELIEACDYYLEAVKMIETGEAIEDTCSKREHVIFEAALEALYGEKIWDYINERLC